MQVHMKKNLFSASFYAKFYSLKISFIANYKIALILKRMFPTPERHSTVLHLFHLLTNPALCPLLASL